MNNLYPKGHEKVTSKTLLILMLGIVLISFASASLESQGTGIQNKNFTIVQTCSDSTYINISTIQFPDKTVQNINENMVSAGGSSFQYNLTDTSQLGRYDVTGISNGCDKTFAFYFMITPNGKDFNTQNSIIYIGFIVVLIFTFFLTIFGAAKVRWKHQKSDEGKILSINHFRYIKVFLFAMAYAELMFLFGLSYKIFSEAGIEGFTQFFNFIYQLFLRLMFPLMIVLIITIFVIWINNRKLSKRLKLGLEK